MTVHEVTEERRIAQPPEIVGKAIASPHGLGTWFCDDARVEKRADGRLILSWNDGRLQVGRWTEFDMPTRLAWRTTAEGAEAPASVSFDLRAEGEGTHLRVTESGIADADMDRAARFWRDAVDDLAVFAESGRNARMARRPMMGINLEVVTPALAAKESLAIDHGIHLTGIVPDSGAEKAGLRAGDVIESLEGTALHDWGSIGRVLGEYRAGDTVTADIWRGKDRLQVRVTLQGHPEEPAPEGRENISAAMREAAERWIARLDEVLADVSDDAAARAPAEGEWSVKQVLAHLSMAERFGHEWLTRLATDSHPTEWAEDYGDFWQTSIATLPIRDLGARIAADLRESAALSLAVLDRQPAPWVERAIAESIHYTGEHVDEHLGQIRANLGMGT